MNSTTQSYYQGAISKAPFEKIASASIDPALLPPLISKENLGSQMGRVPNIPKGTNNTSQKNNAMSSSSSAAAAAAKSAIKYKKAPGAPKRFKPAFIFYSAAKHKEIRTQLGEKSSTERTANIAKEIAEAWKKLTPDEKIIWEEMARADKLRYDFAKLLYKGPWRVPTLAQKTKDTKAPRRPKSAFLAFANSRRAGVIRDKQAGNVKISNGEVSKLLASMWREAPEDVRQKYLQEAAAARQEHELILSDWKEKTSNDIEHHLLGNRKIQEQDTADEIFDMDSLIWDFMDHEDIMTDLAHNNICSAFDERDTTAIVSNANILQQHKGDLSDSFQNNTLLTNEAQHQRQALPSMAALDTMPCEQQAASSCADDFWKPLEHRLPSPSSSAYDCVHRTCKDATLCNTISMGPQPSPSELLTFENQIESMEAFVDWQGATGGNAITMPLNCNTPWDERLPRRPTLVMCRPVNLHIQAHPNPAFLPHGFQFRRSVVANNEHSGTTTNLDMIARYNAFRAHCPTMPPHMENTAFYSAPNGSLVGIPMNVRTIAPPPSTNPFYRDFPDGQLPNGFRVD